MTTSPHPLAAAQALEADGDEGASMSFIDVLTWLGEGKFLIAGATLAVAAAALIYALLLPPVFSARTSLLPPTSQQSSGSAAALAALGSLGGLAGGLGAKSSEELYVALLKSESVTRALDERFGLKARYEVPTNEILRRVLPQYVRVSSDKKTGVITVEVDDKDAKFAAELANAHVGELSKVLARLAISEAQQRRVFFEQQLKESKENLVKAEAELQRVQKQSGVFVLDKQAEALVTGASQIRGLIGEREVQLRVLRNSSTEQNPEVIRLNAEINALRAELARLESSRSQAASGPLDMTMSKIPDAALAYVRARRELKIQETLLEAMVRQFELAKLDEAKEGPLLQQIDTAVPPDYKSKPSRARIVLGATLAALLVSTLFVIGRRYILLDQDQGAESRTAWAALRQAWRLKPRATAN
ncbi:Wzz/FepE/Etk N-terminal domain-containing protein [Rubrivivax rivuli]|uniref:Chain-length determining protein n=1 Tax=Rubrivivax rivuli TaxID=1862385 RepID=A0A437RBY4_9BURK|nr:Wzz/FepE/Etk N-terminal domain-containing protein [Rubrivivax rivuli]RVU44207.1 chain-length determining protein [Rubrivivax rivuli]